MKPLEGEVLAPPETDTQIRARRKATHHRRMIWIGWLAVALTLGVFFAWAGFADLARGAHVVGQVVVAEGRKKIQHLERGIVKEIQVAEGDKVKAGDVLVVLDDQKVRTEYALVRAQWIDRLVTLARLSAEYRGDDSFTLPEALADAPEKALVRKVYQDQLSLFRDRRKELSSEISILEEKIVQLGHQIDGMHAQQKANRRQYRLIDEELQGLRKLNAKGAVPTNKVREVERQEARLEGEYAARKSEIARSKVAIAETRLQILKTRQGMRRQAIDEIGRIRVKLSQLEERMAEVKARLDRSLIRAPIGGQVIHLAVHTRGAVIRPGQVLMEIVPAGAPLIIEAKVHPQDADVVHEGELAEIRFSSLPRRLAPMLQGRVVSFAQDATLDKASKQAFFLARIRIDDKEMAKLRDLVVLPGMPAQVLLVAGHRTPLDYLITPVEQLFERAMRED